MKLNLKKRGNEKKSDSGLRGLKKKGRSPILDKMIEGLSKVFIPATQLQMEKDIDKLRVKTEATRKRLRIEIQDLRIWCENCLGVRAAIYSTIFEKNLCDSCEEHLEMAVAAETLERLSKRKKKANEQA